MPKREDLFDGSEYDNPDLQLHRHVMFPAQAGDMIVVDARGDMSSGIFGEMMLTYLAGRGGAGVVIDGCIRDSGPARTLDLGIWVRGATPNYHAQTALIPFAVNVPVACGGVLVMPGDIVVADDDGAVVVPIALASEVIAAGSDHAEWEEFSRHRLSQGGDLRVYYPLTEEAQQEYLAWRSARAPTG
jgi:regulator of RNase E activity RraA